MNDRIDEIKSVTITFLDLAKAYDTVCHNILLKELVIYEIRGLAGKLLRSFLSYR